MEINQIHKNVVLTVDPITNVVNIEVTQVISPPVILEVSEVGRKGDQGVKGDTGNDGLSAYQIAINNGTFTGTEVEFAIMQASVANKLDKGGYQGTAQDLSDSIQNIYQPDTVIRYTAPTRVGNTFTFPSGGYDVLLSKQFHTNVSELETTIAAATDGFKRIDLVYFKSDNTIAKIEGNESATVAVRPEVPAGGIELCLINVFGATIEVPEVNGAYVQKSERANVVLTGSGVINQLNLVDEKATIVFKDAITRLNTISYASVPYNGKRITLFNAQATPVTIGHSVSGYGVDFVFLDGQDYILLPNQTIEFSFDITYSPYAHHMLIGSKGITNWSELQGKPSTFPHSAHTHTISEITDFPTFKTIEGQSIIGAGNIDLDKNSVGLGNVDNTSDLNKIISTATQTALNAKANISGQVFTGAISATNLNGNNTGDNAPNSLYSGLISNVTHTGDVTGATDLTIANGVVTNSKLASVATATIKGRVTAGSGIVEDLNASQVRTLLNVANGANNYVHPANHLASIITQDANNRFVTDTEKSAWNAKEPAIASGTISQYWRGDKTWQPFPAQATVDQTIIDGSTNAVSSNAVFDGLALKSNIGHTHVASQITDLSKASVGLGNVDNTSDLSKPLSTATINALATKAPISSVHNPVTLGTANGLSLATQQLSLGLASSSTTGALSGTDWNTFNGKFNTPTGLTTNHLPKWTGSSFGNSQIFDNGTNIGIGTTTPNAKFDVAGVISSSLIDATPTIVAFNQGTVGFPLFQLINVKNGVQKAWNIENGRTVNGDLGFYNLGGERVTFKDNGRVLINKTNDDLTNQLQVAGTISASPATTANQVPTWGQVQAIASSGTYTPSNQTNAAQTVNFMRSYWERKGNVLTVTTSLTYTVTQIQSTASFSITLPNGFLVSGASGRIIGSSLLHNTQSIFNNNANMKAYETPDSSQINLQANFQATASSGTYETTIIYTVLIQ